LGERGEGFGDLDARSTLHDELKDLPFTNAQTVEGTLQDAPDTLRDGAPAGFPPPAEAALSLHGGLEGLDNLGPADSLRLGPCLHDAEDVLRRVVHREDDDLDRPNERASRYG
jgi:hypothetical protein